MGECAYFLSYVNASRSTKLTELAVNIVSITDQWNSISGKTTNSSRIV